MPNNDFELAVKQLENGQEEIILPSGERYVGTPEENKRTLAKSKYDTANYARQMKQRADEAEARLAQLQQQQQAPPQTVADYQLQEYMTKTVLGMTPQEVAEYKKRQEENDRILREINEQRNNEKIAVDFQGDFPEYPGTKEANEALVNLALQISGTEKLRYSDLVAAHAIAVKQNIYQPLRPEEYNSQGQMQQASGTRTAPPTPPTPGAPSGQENQNPWAMQQDELRKKVLEGGGLGKLLMDLPPGGSL